MELFDRLFPGKAKFTVEELRAGVAWECIVVDDCPACNEEADETDAETGLCLECKAGGANV